MEPILDAPFLNLTSTWALRELSEYARGVVWTTSTPPMRAVITTTLMEDMSTFATVEVMAATETFTLPEDSKKKPNI